MASSKKKAHRGPRAPAFTSSLGAPGGPNRKYAPSSRTPSSGRSWPPSRPPAEPSSRRLAAVASVASLAGSTSNNARSARRFTSTKSVFPSACRTPNSPRWRKKRPRGRRRSLMSTPCTGCGSHCIVSGMDCASRRSASFSRVTNIPVCSIVASWNVSSAYR